MIWCFIKFFEKEEYADAFLSGSLYLNTLKYFKELENECDGRGDRAEAVSMWLQPQGVAMTLKAPGFSDILITEKDLAGPTSFACGSYDGVHLLCLYAVHSDEAARAGESGGQWKYPIGVDPRCLRFGKFAVIILAQPFLDLLKKALPTLGYEARGKLVAYYDDASFNGEIPIADVPFMKQKRFEYQREFRLCIYSRAPTSRPITVPIGDLTSIGRKMEASQLLGCWLEFCASA
jgi:hypothetical protein